jgi:hypothetical protein
LLLVVVTPLLVASVVSVLASRLNDGEDSRAGVAQATASAEPAETKTPLPGPALTPATPPPEAFMVVDKFLQIWLAGPTAESAQEWHQRLAPYVTPEMAAGLQETDPDHVPDITVAASPQALRVGEYLSQMSVHMADGSDVFITVTWDGHAWRVSDIEREGGR